MISPSGIYGVNSRELPVKRRMYATKQLAVAQMKIMLEQTKSLWFQAITEARPNPSKDALMRAWAAQYSVMENANEIAQLAVRTCGGQAMLRCCRSSVSIVTAVAAP